MYSVGLQMGMSVVLDKEEYKEADTDLWTAAECNKHIIYATFSLSYSVQKRCNAETNAHKSR